MCIMSALKKIRSLSDEESEDPNGEWSQTATRKDHGVSGHTFGRQRVVAHDFANTSFWIPV